MKNTLRIRVVLGFLFATMITPSTISAQQERGKQEPAKVGRKTGVALQTSAVTRVEAVYPPSALAARVFGTVLVEVAVDESGSVTSARAISGHPLLKEAAVDAARGWTFKQTLVEGKPIKALGTLTFTFKLPDHIARDRIIEQLKQQIARTPQDHKLYYRLGLAYEENEQLGDALKAYERAVALKPTYGQAQVALGSLNMKMNQYDKALSAYNQAVLLDLPSETRGAAYRAVALIHFRRDRFREAVEPFKKAIALAPQGIMHLNLGLTYLKLGDRASAMEQYQLLKERNSILAAQLLNHINEQR